MKTTTIHVTHKGPVRPPLPSWRSAPNLLGADQPKDVQDSVAVLRSFGVLPDLSTRERLLLELGIRASCADSLKDVDDDRRDAHLDRVRAIMRQLRERVPTPYPGALPHVPWWERLRRLVSR